MDVLAAIRPGFDPYANHPDTGGLYSGIEYRVKRLHDIHVSGDTGDIQSTVNQMAHDNYLRAAIGKTGAQKAAALKAAHDVLSSKSLAESNRIGAIALAAGIQQQRPRQLQYTPSGFNKFVGNAASSVGSAVNSVGQTVAKGVDSVAKAAIAVAEAPISLTNKAIGAVIPGAEAALNKAFSPATFVGRTVVNAAAGVVKGAVATVTNPNLDNIVATAQSALKAFAPVGLVASGALGAMKAGLQGKSAAEIAWAAAEGAAPIGIDAAVKAAHAIANGDNVLTSAIAGAVGAVSAGFVPASQEAFGFNIGLDTLKKAATKEALGVARNALPSEGAKRAFDAAVGVVGSVALKGKIDVPELVKSAVNQAEKELPKVAIAAAGKVLPHQVTDVLNTAMSLANGKVTPQTLAELAKKNLTPAMAIELAKKNLPSNASALISAAQSASQSGVSNLMRNPMLVRAGSLPIVSLGREAVKLSAVPSAAKAVVDAVKNNPALLAGNRQLLAQHMRTNAATVNDAMHILQRTPGSLLPWRSLSPTAVSFIRKYAPNASIMALRHAHTDIGGLDATGTTYIVEKGDGPWAIAQKVIGNGNRWKEMLDYNKDKKPTIDKNVWVGEIINLPPSWQKPKTQASPKTPALPSVPAPSIGPTPDVVTQVTNAATSVVPSILQAKAILAAWGKTDGINQSGLPDYGLNPADMSTTMGPRDTMMLQSFQVWDNKTLNDGLTPDGNLDSKTLQALQQWASARANAASSSATPTVSPGLPTINPTPTVTVIPELIGGTAPSITVTPKPATTPAATPTVASKPQGGSMAPVAIGAVIGGLLFGVPGALVGAAGGAAIS